MRLKPEEISRVIREQIKNYEAKVSEADTGTVLIVGDGIARVSGLDRCVAGELLHDEALAAKESLAQFFVKVY